MLRVQIGKLFRIVPADLCVSQLITSDDSFFWRSISSPVLPATVLRKTSFREPTDTIWPVISSLSPVTLHTPVTRYSMPSRDRMPPITFALVVANSGSPLHLLGDEAACGRAQ